MNEQVPSKELLPCPFCGSPARGPHFHEHDRTPGGYWWIECAGLGECCTVEMTESKEAAIARWNQRHTPEPGVHPISEVAGDTLPTSLWDFENRCKVWLDSEQAKPSPCNALINLICDAVRLARENERMTKARPAPPPVPEWQPIETAPTDDGSCCIVAVPNYNNKAIKNPPMLIGEAHLVVRSYAYGTDVGWFWAGEEPTDSHGPGMIFPTHWMPLPSPPTKESAP